MSAKWIITIFVVIDDLLQQSGHQTDSRRRVSDSEILTVALCAAKFCQNYHECTVIIMQQQGYLSGKIRVARFNRRLHKLADWLEFSHLVLSELERKGKTFIIDSMPFTRLRR